MIKTLLEFFNRKRLKRYIFFINSTTLFQSYSANYPECKFTLPDNFCKKKLGKTNVKNLLEGEETVIKNIKKADKNTYSAVVKLYGKGFIDFVVFSK
ncbi:topoisomerase C-terminal repeat-containing protein [Bacillus toyonensis]|uniref:topoisomerase C-terminal repeat-containing protein n=1 Tax=Bacillus toyonensis TaxID=155322 RepID=UPI003AFA5E10